MWKQLVPVPLFLSMLAVLVAVLDHQPVNAWVVVNGMAIWFALFAAILWHELGHAAFARLVGLRVRRLRVGAGRRLFSLERGRFRLQLHALPLHGAAAWDRPDGLPRRWQLFVAVLGGPLFSAAVVAAIALTSSHGFRGLWPVTFTRAPQLLELFACWNAWMLINLLPFRLGFARSDGLQLLTLPFLSAKLLAEQAAQPAFLDVLDELETGSPRRAAELLAEARARLPDSASLAGMVPNVDIALGRYREAYDGIERLLAGPLLVEAMRPLLQNNAAWAALRSGDPGLLEAADRLSASAFARCASVPAVRSTRGGVLLHLGRLDEAAPLLERAHLEESDDRNRARLACQLGMLAAAAGDAPGARAWLARVRQEDAGCDLLGEAEAWVAART